MKNKIEKKTKLVPKAQLPNLVDVCVDDEGNVVFLMKGDNGLETFDSVKLGGRTYCPPPRSAMPWALPRASKVVEHYNKGDDAATLFNDIKNAIYSNSELPDDKLYSFLAGWVLHTHLIDQFNYSPVVIFHAVAAKGKTRTGRVLLSMARRSLHLETVREADLIRKAERFTATFFFDVVDVWKRAERLGAEDVLLGRFDRGITVARVTNPDRNGFSDTQHFSCFGPTLVATNEPANRYLDSRGIIIHMREAKREFKNDPRESHFLDLRERATAFRAHWMDKTLPEVEKPSKNRLGDITRPILQILTAVVPERVGEFHQLIHQFENEAANALAETREGRIVAALLEVEDELVQGCILTKTLTDQINEDKLERFHMSPVSVGKIMAALGFKPTTVKGKRGFIYDERLLNCLQDQYGLADYEADDADNTDYNDREEALKELKEKTLF